MLMILLMKKGVLRAAVLGATLAGASTALAADRPADNNACRDIDITQQTVSVTGKPVKAMTVGGTIPGPVIEATEGDNLCVTFHNKMDVPTSIHWHGVLVPNNQDGVEGVTPPIAAHGELTYRFPVRQHGTYWYHSHTAMQEQRGVYGPLVFHPKDGELVKSDAESVLVLSDWTDEDPHQVLHNLKRDDNYYALKKNTVQSWWDAIRHGGGAVKTKLHNDWTRMGAMDVSDVGYDAFLADGEKIHKMPDIKPGQSVRLRLINASSSTYFNVQFAGGKLNVVAADGQDVQPFELDKLRLGMGETYDVIVTMPQDGKAYEFRATAEDGTGYSTTVMGQGELVKAPDLPKPDLYAPMKMHAGMDMKGMDMGGMAGMDMSHMDHDMPGMDHSHMNHGGPATMDEYEKLRALGSTVIDGSKHPMKMVDLKLTGTMQGYTWGMKGGRGDPEGMIRVREGDWVMMTITNETMMEHPIHLHGHFFRVMNGQGENSPLKHTVNVPPMGKVNIEFLADEPGDWLLHCHNLYHMTTGMMMTLMYEKADSAPANMNMPGMDMSHMDHDMAGMNMGSLKGPGRPDGQPMKMGDSWFPFADINLQNNMAAGLLRLENRRNTLNLEFDANRRGQFDVNTDLERRVAPYFSVFGGVDIDHKEVNGPVDPRAVAGVRYTLPMMVDLEARVDHKGHPRIELRGEPQLTKRVSLEWRANTDKEVRANLNLAINEKLSVTGGYDTTYGAGVGIKLKF